MSSTVSIRAFEERDIEPAAKVSSDIELFQEYGLNPKRAREILEEHLNEKSRFLYTALIDNHFAGMIDIVEKGFCALTPYVQQLVVSQKYSGQGVGRRLMNFFEENYKNKYGFSLLVNEKNQSAISFYEKLGYSRIGKVEGYIRPNLNELIYFKK